MSGERAVDRPALWVGHVTMTVTDPRRAHDFYSSLGMRTVLTADELCIVELRGGTHIVFERGDPDAPGDAPFDLMTDDLPGMHEAWSAAGHDVSEIIPGEVHDVFVLTDDDGYRTIVFNSHVVGPV